MVHFQKATSGDIAHIRQLARDIWFRSYNNLLSVQQIEYMQDMMYSAEVIEHEISQNYLWELIYVDHELAGFISVSVVDGDLKLHKLYVNPDLHGKGVGQKALQRAIMYGKKLGCKGIYLNVNKQNYKAIKAYERAGFKRQHEEVNDIGEGYVMDDYVYRADL